MNGADTTRGVTNSCSLSGFHAIFSGMEATKRCSKCKEVKLLSEFHSDKTNLDGKRCDCISCVSIRRKKYYADHAEIQKQYSRDFRKKFPEKTTALVYLYQQTIPGRYAKLKCESKKRGIAFELTLEQYESLMLPNRCHYDGEHILPTHGHGLDRKKSSLGYTVDNCVPCCWKCNLIRGEDNVTYEEMLAVAKLLKQMRAKEQLDGSNQEVVQGAN